MPAMTLLNTNKPDNTWKISLPSSLGGTRPSNHNVPAKTRIADSAAKARFQYVPRRREATRNSRSTIGKNVIGHSGRIHGRRGAWRRWRDRRSVIGDP